MIHRKFPNLLGFLGGNFHQDCLYDFGTYEDVLNAALDDNVDFLALSLQELRVLQAEPHSDEKLREIVLTLCDYDATADGGPTMRDWLKYVATRLEEAIEKKKASDDAAR